MRSAYNKLLVPGRQCQRPRRSRQPEGDRHETKEQSDAATKGVRRLVYRAFQCSCEWPDEAVIRSTYPVKPSHLHDSPRLATRPVVSAALSAQPTPARASAAPPAALFAASISEPARSLLTEGFRFPVSLQALLCSTCPRTCSLPVLDSELRNNGGFVPTLALIRPIAPPSQVAASRQVEPARPPRGSRAYLSSAAPG